MTNATVVANATMANTMGTVETMVKVGHFVWNEQTQEAEIVWSEEPGFAFMGEKSEEA